jgi:hypothetical protein
MLDAAIDIHQRRACSVCRTPTSPTFPTVGGCSFRVRVPLPSLTPSLGPPGLACLKGLSRFLVPRVESLLRGAFGGRSVVVASEGDVRLNGLRVFRLTGAVDAVLTSCEHS